MELTEDADQNLKSFDFSGIFPIRFQTCQSFQCVGRRRVGLNVQTDIVHVLVEIPANTS